jgi:hypothetical protein
MCGIQRGFRSHRNFRILRQDDRGTAGESIDDWLLFRIALHSELHRNVIDGIPMGEVLRQSGTEAVLIIEHVFRHDVQLVHGAHRKLLGDGCAPVDRRTLERQQFPF